MKDLLNEYGPLALAAACAVFIVHARLLRQEPFLHLLIAYGSLGSRTHFGSIYTDAAFTSLVIEHPEDSGTLRIAAPAQTASEALAILQAWESGLVP